MAPDKSLAAEIEADTAALRLAIHAWIREDAPLSAKMNLLPAHVDALMARLAAEIAALQGRAFEDGARWMQESAAGCATAWRVRPEKAFRAGFRPQQVSVRNNAADHIATAIQALPLQPEGERSDA